MEPPVETNFAVRGMDYCSFVRSDCDGHISQLPQGMNLPFSTSAKPLRWLIIANLVEIVKTLGHKKEGRGALPQDPGEAAAILPTEMARIV